MHYGSTKKILIALCSILSLIFLFITYNVASASVIANTGGTFFDQSGSTMLEYRGTNDRRVGFMIEGFTVSSVESIQFPLCNLSSTTGLLYLTIWSTLATTSPYVTIDTGLATSTPISFADLPSCGAGPNFNYATTTFFFNQNLPFHINNTVAFLFNNENTVSGNTQVLFRRTNVPLVSQFPLIAYDNPLAYRAFVADCSKTSSSPCQGSSSLEQQMVFTLSAGLQAQTPNIIPTATSSASFNFNCDTLELGCYLKEGFAWAFYPDDSVVSQFNQLTIADKFPFSYWYDLKTKIASSSATSSGAFPVLQIRGFGGVTTTVLSYDILEDYAGAPFLALLVNILAYGLWIALAYHIFIRIQEII
jgi:hypothetical protein